jgi:hypothetical protein
LEEMERLEPGDIHTLGERKAVAPGDHDPETTAAIADKLDRLDEAERQAEAMFRHALSEEGGPVAYVRDPRSADSVWLRVDRREWIIGLNFVPGFGTNLVSPDDPTALGPASSFVDGHYRPVFFRKDQFETFINGFKHAKAIESDLEQTKRGRPSSMPDIEKELDLWISGRRQAIVENLKKYGETVPSVAALARALQKYAITKGLPHPTGSKAIENSLREKLRIAYEYL